MMASSLTRTRSTRRPRTQVTRAPTSQNQLDIDTDSDIDAEVLAPYTDRRMQELEEDDENQPKTTKVDSFLDYFIPQWVTSNSGWYEGYCTEFRVPSTNNALESCNRYVKEYATLRERAPLPQFLDTVKTKLIHYWSRARDPANVNFRPFETCVLIGLKEYTDAWEWLQKKKKIIVLKLRGDLPSSALQLYFVGAGDRNITKREAQTFLEDRTQRIWRSFEEYKAQSSIRMMTMHPLLLYTLLFITSFSFSV